MFFRAPSRGSSVADTAFITDRFQKLVASASQEDLLDAFWEAQSALGGEGFAMASLPETTRMVVDYNRGLNGWCEYFIENGLAATCAVTEKISTAVRPFTWHEVRAQVKTPEQAAVFEAADKFGISDGVIVPVRARFGYKGDIFVRMARDLLTPVMQEAISMLAMMFHSRLSVLQTKPVPSERGLSGRERDVLTWFAFGKSAQDVAEIMGISSATVMFHYRNVSERFGTLTRTHTVVDAIRRGAISVC
jgi:LuxR family transcriptional regulator, quorum-sensing system regulator BjaR1